MPEQSFVFLITLNFWILSIFGTILLVFTWKRLSALFLSLFCFLFVGWSYYAFQALLYQHSTSTRAFFLLASMLVFLTPPLFYHTACLMIKRARHDIFFIAAVYLVNAVFLYIAEIRNFIFLRAGRFDIQFFLLPENFTHLYQAVFFGTVLLT